MLGKISPIVGCGGLLPLLLACRPGDQPPTSAAPADTADQVIYGLTHHLTVDGLLRVRLKADTALFFESNQTADLTGVHVTFFSPTGAETSNLTSRKGTYEWRTGNMMARGNVVAVTPDGRKLTTSTLKYTRADQRIVGAEPFVFDSPGRHLEGASFTSDPDFKNVVTTKPKKGTVGEVPLQ